MDFLEIFELHAPLKHKAKQIRTRNGSNVQDDLDRLERLYAVTNGTEPEIQTFSLGEYEKVSDMDLAVYAELNGLICRWYLNLECVDAQDIEGVLFFDGVIVNQSKCVISAVANQKVYLSGMFEYFGEKNKYHTIEIMIKTEKDKVAKTIGLNRGLTCEEKNVPILTDEPQEFGWKV